MWVHSGSRQHESFPHSWSPLASLHPFTHSGPREVEWWPAAKRGTSERGVPAPLWLALLLARGAPSLGEQPPCRPCPAVWPPRCSCGGRPGPVLPATGGVGLPLGFSLNSHRPTERSHFLLSGRKVVFTSTHHFYFYFSVCPDSGWEKRTFREPNIKLDWEDIRLEIRRPVSKLLWVPIKMMRAWKWKSVE